MLPGVLAVLCVSALPVAAAPADTWHLLAAQPAGVGDAPVSALTVDPSVPARLLYGTETGEIYRSSDGGATFARVATGIGHGVLALAFDPIEPTHVLAGTRGAGIWRSEDSGGTWHPLDKGSETVRSFAFSEGLSVAGTDSGVLVTTDGDTWTPADLQDASVAAVAVGGGSIIAGADIDRAAQGLPLFKSGDAGASWKPLSPPAGAGQIVSSLSLGTSRLLLGTATGLYASSDSGASWTALSGSATLPATDFTTLVPAGSRLYAASDGGAGLNGGLWASDDGQTFRTLAAPIHTVTAVAVTGSTVYAATFRPVDHAVQLWSYVDDGGAPQPPDKLPPSPAPFKAAAATSTVSLSSAWLTALVRGPEAPYLALGAGAVLILFLALVAYLRRGRA